MAARAAPAHVHGPAAKAVQVFGVRPARGDPSYCVRERPQPEETRTALSRALRGKVAHDPGRLANRTTADRQYADHATPQAVAGLFEACSVELERPGLVRLDPRAEVAAQQDGA